MVWWTLLLNERPLLRQDAQIINWLQEFRSCVTHLTKDHEQLIYTILVSVNINTMQGEECCIYSTGGPSDLSRSETNITSTNCMLLISLSAWQADGSAADVALPQCPPLLCSV